MKWLYLLAAVAAALLVVREALLLTRGKRIRAAMARGPEPASDPRTRLARKAAMPVFLFLVAIIVLAGMLVAVAIGPH